MKTLFMAYLLLQVFLVASCVGTGGGVKNFETSYGGINQNEVPEPDGSNVQGNYAADIWPVNYNLQFKKIGTIGISRAGDNFTTTVKMKYGPRLTTVKQALYTGRRCPNINDDLNKDAYIDILEARLAIGMITIPFDDDLDSQSAGSGQYPQVDESGKMAYSRSASFSRLFADLKAPDETPDDLIIKLSEAQGITFPGRIVLFQGMPLKVALPVSVATTEREESHESIPVGCAVLWKVNEMPVELGPSEGATP